MKHIFVLIISLLLNTIVFAESVEISDIKIIRHGDASFSVSFMYGSHNLTVTDIQNKTSKDQVLELIKAEIIRWKEQCAEENIQEIITTYDGNTVTVNVP